MSKNVKIVIGSHGSGKSDWIYNRFLDNSRKDDDKSKVDLTKKFYLVVPEQDTNDKQRLLMHKSMEKKYGSGIINIDVVSFDRIAHNVFDILNIEPLKENVIDDDMKTMILSLVLSKLAKANKLKYCNKMVNRVGFARKLTQVVSEFYAYSVSDEDIDKVLKDKKSDIYKDRLNDFKLIFNEFKKVLTDMNFFISEDKYDLLNKRIADVNIFNGAIVAFDGFTGFTPIQLSIFKQIAEVAKEVYVVIDHRNPEEIKNFDIKSNIDDIDLFYLSKKFIKDIAENVGANSIDDLLFEDSIKKDVYKYLNNDKEDLRCIEKNLYEFNYSNNNIKPKNITYFAADNIKDEILNVVQQIFDLVRNKGYKYNDIRIVVPNVENYRDSIIKLFDLYNIPLFIDDSEGILNSPYIETIRAAIDVLNYNFSYESVMRYINSGITKKTREIYEFNNFVLKHAVKGYNRYKTGFEKIKISDDREKKIVFKVKEKFIDPLLTMYDKLKGKRDIKNYLDAIKEYIENASINEKYEELEKYLGTLASKDASYNRTYAILKYSKEVVENVINDLSNLEKYKANNTNEYIDSDISIEEFKRMFDAGLDNKALKSIPFLLDQVVVGDLMRSRFDNPKIEFVLGLNQSAIPAKNPDVNLIDDAIRKLFIDNVKELSQRTIETTLNQRFYIYLILTNPKEKLFLSYTKVNSEGESDDKSSVLIMLENIFGVDDKKENVLKPIMVDSDTFKFYRYNDLVSYVALNMEDIKKYGRKDEEGNFEYEFPPEIEKRIVKAKTIFKYLKSKSDFDKKYDNIFNQQFFHKDVKLNQNAITDLLNANCKDYKGSATSIESFNKCPFKFFMERTLGLRENAEYNITPVDIGNIAHGVFKSLFSDEKISEKSIEEINSIVDERLEKEYSSIDAFNEFNKDDKDYLGANKLTYIKSRIKDLMHHSTNVLIEMVKASKFKTAATEFGFEYNINENSTDLEDLVLTGRIDRIDVCDIDGKTYVNVIDYKSGNKEKALDLKEIKEGVNIQLTLYIDFCLNKEYIKDGKEPIFAGAFYFWVDEGKKRYEDFVENDKESENLMKENMTGYIGYNGVSNDNDEVLSSVYNDPKIEKNSKGKVNAVKLKNGYKIDGNYIDEEKLKECISLMREKANETVKNIKEGVITAKPYKSTTCDYCAYSDICKKEQLIINEEGDN